MPSRIAARSTTQGTPVKSCSSTRAGMNEISFCASLLRVPARERLDVVGLDEAAVLVPQQVLEQDLQRERQPRRRRGSPARFERGQAEEIEGNGTRGVCLANLERIE